MQLTCPACSTRYLVDPASLGGQARQVRCAKCPNIWVVEPPPPDDNPIPVLTAPSEFSPIPSGSNLPVPHASLDGWWKNNRAMLMAFLALLAFSSVVLRDRVVETLPEAAFVYRAVGVPVPKPGTGLRILQVRSEYKQDKENTTLHIEGQIMNSTGRVVEIPELQISGLSEDNRVVSHWIVAVDPKKLPPGGAAAFSLSAPYTGELPAEIEVSFGNP